MNADDLRPIRNREDALDVQLPERAALRLPKTTEDEISLRYPLRGKSVRLIDPMEPVAGDEWEADQ